MDSKVKTYIQTKQQPDVLNYNKFSDFARDDLIYKADEAVSPKLLDDYLPLFADQAKYKGVQYGLPFISSARLFFYNKEIFSKVGVAAPPTSWAEVEAVAKKIKTAGGHPPGPAARDVGGTAMKGAMVGPVGPTAEAGRVGGGAGSVVDQTGRPGA